MQSHGEVLVQLENGPVPGLLLKWSRDQAQALVTYEVDHRVETVWVPAERILPG